MRNSYNTTIEAILNRRSCRSFKQKQVNDLDLSTTLKCGLYAPSARNKQPWDIIYVQDPQLLDEINEDCIAFIKSNNPELATSIAKSRIHIFHNAPTVVFISGESNNCFSMIDCSLVTENMLLAAHSLGISSCVIGLVTEFLNGDDGKKYRQKLVIPQEYNVCLAISLGYANITMDSPQQPGRRDESKIRKY